jgi:hypothetical protein
MMNDKKDDVKMDKKCVVCSVQVHNSNSINVNVHTTTGRTGAEERLVLLFFFKKFLTYTILPESCCVKGDESNKDVEGLTISGNCDLGIEEGEESRIIDDEAESLLKNRAITEGICFCTKCFRWVSKARKLCLQLAKLEEKLNDIRTSVEYTLWETYTNEGERETVEPDAEDVRNSVRKLIYEQCTDKGEGIRC